MLLLRFIAVQKWQEARWLMFVHESGPLSVVDPIWIFVQVYCSSGM